jgi:aquaporin Z
MKVLAEFLGSFLFMSVIALMAPSGSPFTPIVVGIGLMCAVYFAGPTSGAHFNPAVSLAVWMQKKMEFKDFLAYVVAQILGACAAFGFGGWITASSGGIKPGLNPVTAQDFTTTQALAVEIFFTMFLCLVIFHVAINKKSAGNSYFGIAIGMTIAAAASAGGWISGGAFNPAVGIGATAMGVIFEDRSWDHLLIYILGPLLGGALASTIYGIQTVGEDGG